MQFVVYGWGRGSLYSSTSRAWPLDEALLGLIAQSRRPFWTTMTDGERQYSTYILNDRVGIYVIGFPVITRIDHLINLAELATLVGLTYAALLTFAWFVSALGGTTAASSGRALLREVRASFYRKLFLAFLAASVLPVMVLAFATRTFFELQLQSSVQSDAVQSRIRRTTRHRGVRRAAAARDRRRARRRHHGLAEPGDRPGREHLRGPAAAGHQRARSCSTSGLLPERTPAMSIARSSSIGCRAHVGQEVVGAVPHVLAAAPVRLEEGRAILTVPLALRQQEVDRQIDTLDRRVLLAARAVRAARRRRSATTWPNASAIPSTA